MPGAPGLVELAHRVIPALAGPRRIVATHQAKYIPRKSGTGKLGLEVPHDGRILRQLGLHEAVWLRRASRLMACPIKIHLEALMRGVFVTLRDKVPALMAYQ